MSHSHVLVPSLFVHVSQVLIDDVFAKFPAWAVSGIGWVLDRMVVSYVQLHRTFN